MRRWIVAVVCLLIAGCGGSTHKGAGPTPAQRSAALLASQRQITDCSPALGAGHMGSCAPKPPPSLTGRLGTLHGTFGVDVSSYQCPAALPRVSFVFVKATEGTTYIDRCLTRTVAAAKRQHIPFGAYDFLRPGRSSATAEAQHFVAIVKRARATGSLPPVADVEANAGLSPSAISRYVCTWHNVVRKSLGRGVTITYTGNWFWGAAVRGSSCGSRLWVSGYATTAIVPAAWERYTIWQFTDGTYGPFPHINRWDTDIIAGGQATIRSLLPHKAKPHPKPTPKPKPSRPAKCSARFPLYNPKRGRHPQGCYRRAGRFHIYVSGRKVPTR